MSLDEIKKQVTEGASTGRRRFYLHRRRRRPRATPAGFERNQGPLAQPSRPPFRPPRAALAVLKRARETAAAAAQAAADAAALIEQNRAERQAHFDELRGLGLPLPFRRSRRGRRRGRGRSGTPATEKTAASKADEEPKRTSRRRSAAYYARRRARLRRRRAEAAREHYFYADAPPMEPYPFPPEPYPPVVDDYPGMVGYRGYEWQDIGAGPEPGFIPPSDRFPVPGSVRYAPSRNDEYLAQARALIQAQNEQLNPGYRVPYEPWPAPYMPGENWGPRSHMRSSRW